MSFYNLILSSKKDFDLSKIENLKKLKNEIEIGGINPKLIKSNNKQEYKDKPTKYLNFFNKTNLCDKKNAKFINIDQDISSTAKEVDSDEDISNICKTAKTINVRHSIAYDPDIDMLDKSDLKELNDTKSSGDRHDKKNKYEKLMDKEQLKLWNKRRSKDFSNLIKLSIHKDLKDEPLLTSERTKKNSSDGQKNTGKVSNNNETDNNNN